MTYRDDYHHDNDKDVEQEQTNYGNSDSYQNNNEQESSIVENRYSVSQESNFEQTKPVEKRKNTKQNSKWAMFLSGITGGITVLLLGIILINNGVITIEQPNQVNTDNVVTDETLQSTQSTGNEADKVMPAVATGNESSLASAIQQASDAVVGVTNIQQAGLWSPTQEAGTGSGVIYKKEDGKAYVVTNNHVVEGAGEVEVILPNGDHADAKVLGADELTDLAVLEMDGSKVTQIAKLGTSKNLTVGDTAIAIGNPLGTEFAGSVTKGIISGLERSVEVDTNGDRQPDWTTEVLQTDAAINPGNSGGALINANGEVIGINSMKIAQEAVEGIGFAIPIDEAKPIIEQLETSGEVSRPVIGISAVNLATVPTYNKQQTLKLDENFNDGVVLAEVHANTPADEAGLKRYDVITKINGEDIKTMMDLKQYLYSETKIGDEITVTYYRDGNENTTTLTLSER